MRSLNSLIEKIKYKSTDSRANVLQSTSMSTARFQMRILPFMELLYVVLFIWCDKREKLKICWALLGERETIRRTWYVFWRIRYANNNEIEFLRSKSAKSKTFFFFHQKFHFERTNLGKHQSIKSLHLTHFTTQRNATQFYWTRVNIFWWIEGMEWRKKILYKFIETKTDFLTRFHFQIHLKSFRFLRFPVVMMRNIENPLVMFSLHPFTSQSSLKSISFILFSIKVFIWLCDEFLYAQHATLSEMENLWIDFFNNKMLFLCCYHYNFVKNRWKIWQFLHIFFPSSFIEKSTWMNIFYSPQPRGSKRSICSIGSTRRFESSFQECFRQR